MFIRIFCVTAELQNCILYSREGLIELTEKEKIEQEDWKDLLKRVLANILVILR